MPITTRRYSLTACAVLFVGGLLMALLWIVFTRVHGSTSYDFDQPVLGRGTLVWGMLLGGVPGLLIAFGLLLAPPHAGIPSARARAGYVLLLVGLILPAFLDLFIWRALGPPFFQPLLAVGALLIASVREHVSQDRRVFDLLAVIGALQLIGFIIALVPLDVSDPLGGYRIYGLFTYLATGIGWLLLGVRLFITNTDDWQVRSGTL